MRRLRQLRLAAWRRRVLVLLWLQGRAKGARITVRIAPDVHIEPGVRISVDARSASVLEIESGVQLYGDVLVHLRGGTVRIGRGTMIRRGSVLNVTGTLEIGERSVLSYGNIVHCADRVRIGRLAAIGEYVTIVDSRHFHDGEHEFVGDNLETAPVDIGDNVWIAPKSSILMGVTIGDEAVVAAHAVVGNDVPPRAIVGGIPAKLLRQR
jgi:acetyltransferase-like isoleucine patch superfamily enzyme